MDADSPLQTVSFLTEKDAKFKKATNKRKKVGNRIRIGEKIAKRPRTPTTNPKHVKVPSRADLMAEESLDDSAVEDLVSSSDEASEGETMAASTFSGALASLLGKAAEGEEVDMSANIMKDAPKPTEEEAEEVRLAAKKAREESRVLALQRKLFANRDHLVPDFSGAELESKLRKVATRGVVKLFNAIKTHQKTVSDPIGVTRSVTDEATKKKFMDTLKKGGNKSTSSTSPAGANEDHDSDLETPSKSLPSKSQKKSTPGSSAPAWDVLRDDYLLGAKMKDWNKESDEE